MPAKTKPRRPAKPKPPRKEPEPRHDYFPAAFSCLEGIIAKCDICAAQPVVDIIPSLDDDALQVCEAHRPEPIEAKPQLSFAKKTLHNYQLF